MNSLHERRSGGLLIEERPVEAETRFESKSKQELFKERVGRIEKAYEAYKFESGHNKALLALDYGHASIDYENWTEKVQKGLGLDDSKLYGDERKFGSFDPTTLKPMALEAYDYAMESLREAYNQLLREAETKYDEMQAETKAKFDQIYQDSYDRYNEGINALARPPVRQAPSSIEP